MAGISGFSGYAGAAYRLGSVAGFAVQPGTFIYEIDITRCGAAGVYSPGSVYSEVVSHGQDGLVVELEQEVWVETILSLAQDEPLRQRLLRNAEVKSTELTGLAQRGYSGLVVPRTGEEEDSW